MIFNCQQLLSEFIVTVKMAEARENSSHNSTMSKVQGNSTTTSTVEMFT
jgi:hypothetical protein